MKILALALSVLLTTPPVQSTEDFSSTDSPDTSPVSPLNPRYSPPPEPPRWGPKLMIGTGAALTIAGLSGLVFGGGCQTRDAQNRCVDPYGGSTLYPSMIVLGLGVTITGGYWYRRLDKGTGGSGQ